MEAESIEIEKANLCYNFAMRTEQLLATTSHRPWPLPAGSWMMRQSWHDLLFAHWAVPPAIMEPHIPAPLHMDTFEGAAWIGVVPFRMSGVRPRRLPALPGLSAFPELNVRTYVRAPDPEQPEPGVLFFSLDAANSLAVAIARSVFQLPYFQARMSLTERQGIIHYTSQRNHGGAAEAEFIGRYSPTGGVYHSRPNTLEHWLTERYCLYTVSRRNRLYRAEVHHAPWPLQPADAEFVHNSMTAAPGIALQGAPVLHFARRLDVLIWRLSRVHRHSEC